ncbi:glycosyltransferase family 2 protein [Desulfonauticus submarinus]
MVKKSLDTISIWPKLNLELQQNLLINSSSTIFLYQSLLNYFLTSKANINLESYNLIIEILKYIWEREPYNGEVASYLWELNKQVQIIPQSHLKLIKQISTLYQEPQNKDIFLNIWLSKNISKIKSFLKKNISQEDNLFWRTYALKLGFYELDQEIIEYVLSLPWPQELGVVLESIRAHYLYLFKQDKEISSKIYTKLIKNNFYSYYFLLAKLEKLTSYPDNQEKVLYYLKKGLSHYPWQVSYWLMLHDILKGIDLEKTSLPGQTGILLYSFNKANDLDNTLQSLTKAKLENCKIFLLLNGCTDNSKIIALKYKKIWNNKLKIIELPVNIGAPAARNWLMHDKDVKKMDWVIYLDDDALIPSDFLKIFGTAVKQYPEAGVWGCKVVEGDKPFMIQHADLHLLPPQQINTPHKLLNISSTISNELEASYDYIRPCCTVTGCCHLFSRQQLEKIGDFDLRFSPSQFDDVDHDLRICLQGKQVIYTGHLKVRHMCRSGKESNTYTPQIANSQANLYKLENKYSPQELKQIQNFNFKNLSEDFFYKYIQIKKFLKF